MYIIALAVGFCHVFAAVNEGALINVSGIILDVHAHRILGVCFWLLIYQPSPISGLWIPDKAAL